MEKHRYVTRKAHGEYPAGSSCLAYRDEWGTLFLEFGDEVLELADGFFIAGVEFPGGSMLDRAVWDLQAQEDARVFELLNQYSGVDR